jgi:hypothetical protein
LSEVRSIASVWPAAAAGLCWSDKAIASLRSSSSDEDIVCCIQKVTCRGSCGVDDELGWFKVGNTRRPRWHVSTCPGGAQFSNRTGQQCLDHIMYFVHNYDHSQSQVSSRLQCNLWSLNLHTSLQSHYPATLQEPRPCPRGTIYIAKIRPSTSFATNIFQNTSLSYKSHEAIVCLRGGVSAARAQVINRALYSPSHHHRQMHTHLVHDGPRSLLMLPVAVYDIYSEYLASALWRKTLRRARRMIARHVSCTSTSNAGKGN